MKYKPISFTLLVYCIGAYVECSVMLRNLSKGTVLLHLSTQIPSEDLETLNYQKKVYFYDDQH